MVDETLTLDIVLQHRSVNHYQPRSIMAKASVLQYNVHGSSLIYHYWFFIVTLTYHESFQGA